MGRVQRSTVYEKADFQCFPRFAKECLGHMEQIGLPLFLESVFEFSDFESDPFSISNSNVCFANMCAKDRRNHVDGLLLFCWRKGGCGSKEIGVEHCNDPEHHENMSLGFL